MKIGVPKEIKSHEQRVALTPEGVRELTFEGHEVLVEKGAGEGSGFTDQEYQEAGAQLVSLAQDVYESSDMIVKVKEPLAPELPLLRPGQILFAYLHLAADQQLTIALLEREIIGVAYETIQLQDGSLPLLAPMSAIAGKLSIQAGATYLEHVYGGEGVLLGGVPGVEPACVVILGGGVVGTNAAKIAVGMGAQVIVVEKSFQRMAHLDDIFQGRLITRAPSISCLDEILPLADLVVGAVLVPGAKTPRLITRSHLKQMKKGSVLVDVSIDQGGCCETSRPCTYTEPVFIEEGVIHYCVTNMPGAVPRTSTRALANATLPYVLTLASHGIERAAQIDPAIRKGINLWHGKLTHEGVAEAHNLECFRLPF
ncbi:alanine dehydrogenase [Candidatus Hakubella thermalkaliphila]|uniref:Alanine dehydrogenase n=2 Tax=Candidatus Hakubella thermalkaliphila TaxID=2754717 RepID=A0A6V8Q7F2_9ACTN|nr:alanine dehydrogenase [Candidatus Hakubella thermalkaliphila]GFP18719.1 alanine dehydrogenase [Candidatus Hakubella thermalkaliphila]GFP31200.1 alanine dehydrogenase [Candidatus Hakubella thermalkaliphila]GFP39326.1 alanine dehydrogenase [Candidatus Hakubella thermalkaliphila]GFP42085.1 alanine dehydrogenase [Candidatus Hakubella thermalkaliphila]